MPLQRPFIRLSRVAFRRAIFAFTICNMAVVRALAAQDSSVVPLPDSSRSNRPVLDDWGGADVAVIFPDSLPDIPRTMSELLAARVPGLFVQRSSGAAGAASWISIRNADAVRGYAPLVIVDGVERVPAIETLGGFSGPRLGMSGLDDIPVESVERVEVLRGPAAAARYGRDARYGVILVSTRSVSGNLRAHLRLTGGRADENADFPANYMRVDASGNPCVLYHEKAGYCTPVELRTYTVLRDRNPFRTGPRRGAQGDVAGTVGALGYAVGALHERADGVLPMDGTDRSSMTLWLLVPIGGRVRLSVAGQASLRGLTQPRQDNGALDVVSAGIIARPIDCSPQSPCLSDTTSHGYLVGTPDYVAQLGDHHRSEHYSPGAFLDVEATSWLTMRAIATVDADRTRGKRVVPPVPNDVFPVFFKVDATTNIRHRTIEQQANANWKAGLFRARSALSIRNDHDWMKGRNSLLLINGSLVLQASSWFDFDDRRTSVRFEQRFTAGDGLSVGGGALYTHSKLDVTDRATRPTIDAFGDVSVRVFGASAPRAGIKSMRLRAAAGQVSGYDSRTFIALGVTAPCTFYPCPQPEFPPHVADRAFELEGGVDIGVAPGNAKFALTAFQRTEKDPNFTLPVDPSTGYSPPIGILRRSVTGAELSAEATLVDVAKLRWNLSAFVSMNKDKVNSLSTGFLVITSPVGNYAAITKGESFAGWWRDSYSWSDANGDVVISPYELTPSYQRSIVGSTRPTRQAALHNVVTILRVLTLGADVDYIGGHKVLNVANALQCRRAQCAALNAPGTSLSEQARAIDMIAGSSYNGTLEPGATVRLRELSAAFHLPMLAALAHANAFNLTLAANNVATWSRYRGLDPEVDIAAPGLTHPPGGLFLPTTRQFTARFTLAY
jgi:TonB-dependent starch-binding outer membrane protein SusC